MRQDIKVFSSRDDKIHVMVRPRKDPALIMEEESLTCMQRMMKEKRTRGDVAERMVQNKDTQCTVVKASWKSFCKPASLALPINDLLIDANLAVMEAYFLANMHVLRMCQLQEPVPVLNQSFFYGCLSAVSVTGRSKTEIKDMRFRRTVDLYHATRCSPDYVAPSSHHLASGIFQNASLQMSTNTSNAVSASFGRRFKRYLKHKHALDGRQAWQLLRDIVADEYNESDELVLSYRNKLPRTKYRGAIWEHPHLVMPLQYEFLQYFEQRQADSKTNDKQLRLFNLVPVKQGFTCSHFKICNNGLYGLLKRGGVKGMPSEGKAWRAVAEQYWRQYFDIGRYETVNRKFAGEILTDGRAVSIVLRKPLYKAAVEKKILLEDYDEIWGLDPGRRALFTCSNEQGDIKSHSTREFYERAKYKSSSATIKTWYRNAPDVDALLKNMPSNKTTSIERLETYLSYVLPASKRLLQFHMAKAFRGQKFNRYIHTQKQMQTICRDLTAKAGKRTLIGFGDWSNQDSAGIIKKSPAGPVKKFEHTLARYCKVVPVDEFRSSKLHHECSCELQYKHRHKHPKKTEARVVRNIRVYSVLFCRNRSCPGIAVDRDVNASRNMLALLKEDLLCGTRPLAYSRGSPVKECQQAQCSGCKNLEPAVCRQPVHSGVMKFAK